MVNRVARNFFKGLSSLTGLQVKLAPSGILKLKHPDFTAQIATNQTNYLTKEIFWSGFRSFEYTDIFIDLAKNTSQFYDIGANIGYFTILAGRVNPDMQITAFEPSVGPLHYLKKNCELNELDATIAPIALSEKNGSLTFYEIQNKKYTYLKHNLAGESNAGSKTTGRNYVPVEVPTITLNEYASKNATKKPVDLIKIDTEGTEHLILGSGREMLSKDLPIIICETLFGMIETELTELMLSLGYEFYNHTEKGLEKVGTLVRDADNGVNNCFFVHPSKYDLIKKYVVV